MTNTDLIQGLMSRVAELEKYSHKPVIIPIEEMRSTMVALESEIRGLQSWRQSAEARLKEVETSTSIRFYCRVVERLETLEKFVIPQTEEPKPDPDIKALKARRREALDRVLTEIELMFPCTHDKRLKELYAAYVEANDEYQDARK